jgi:hypothetical protein
VQRCKKDNSTDTCTVERLTTYYSKGEANNAAYNKKLGTKRTIWTRSYNVNMCYDQSIRTFYNQVGGSFIGFSGLIIIFTLGVILYEGIKSCFNRTPNTQQNYSYQTI